MDLFYLILKVQGFPIVAASAELSHVGDLGREEFAIWKKNKAWEIAKFHFENNAFYREKVGSRIPDSWEYLPVINKSDFQKPLSQLVSSGINLNDCYVSSTSGSSGHPFFFAKDKYAHAITWALIRKRYKIHNISGADLEARFYGIPLSGKAAYIEKWKDKLMRRVRFPVFNLSDPVLDNFIERFRTLKFGYIYGYTNSIRHFAAHVLHKGITLNKLCPTLKAVIVTSEMCTPSDRSVIEQAMGVPVVIEYGASEVGIIAIDDGDHGLKASEELLLLETNDRGELLVTSLFNKAFPFIRYNIGDLALLEEYDGHQYIKALQGRSDDMVMLPGGRVAAGLTLYYCSRDILQKSGKIKELYITQKELAAFEIYYVADEVLSAGDKSIMQVAFDVYLQQGLSLHFVKTDVIRRKKNGKFQLFYSELS